jgi:ABC-type glutathione transport system ATPase component
MVRNVAVLEVEDVTKIYRSRGNSSAPALGGVNAFVDSNTRMGIVGESGSGKSTLVRTMVGLETPTTGRVAFRGQNLQEMGSADRREFRRAVQLIAQDTSSSFDPRRTLRDSVRRPAQNLLGADRRRADELVDETLALVGLSPPMADRKPHEVSGGQRQRFSIARALIVKPGVIICDEVVSAMDVSVQGTVLNLLKRYCASADAGLVFVSHGLPATAFVSETIAVMKDGLIVEQGPTHRILHECEHPYTQALLGAHRGQGASPPTRDGRTGCLSEALWVP